MSDIEKTKHELDELNRLKRRVAELEAQLEGENTAGLKEKTPIVEIANLLSAVDTLKTGLTIADATQDGFPLIYINHAFEEMTGYPANEVLGYNCRFLQGPTTNPAAVQKIRRTLANHESCTVELLNYRKDGTPFWNELTLNPIFDAEGELVRYVGLQTDVTWRKTAEQALQESESKFRTLSHMTAAGILIHQGGVFLYLNPAAEKITGYRVKELLHRKFWEVVHPDYQDMVRRRGLSRLQGDMASPQYEIKIIRKDGAERWVHLTNGLIDYDGRPAVISTVFDITERKEIETTTRRTQEIIRRNALELEERVAERTVELAASEARLRTFLESSPDPIVIYDDIGHVTYVNPMFTQTFGWHLNEIHGRRLNFVPDGYWQETEQTLEKLFTEGRVLNFETKRLTKDGRILDVDISAGRLDHVDGTTAGMVIILRDATQRKAAERELHQYKNQLEERVAERTAELHQSEQRTLALLDAVPDVIMRLQPDGTYIDVHIPDSFATPMVAEQMIGKTPYDVMPHDLAEMSMQFLHKALESGQLQQFEYTRPYEETGEVREYEARVAPSGTGDAIAIIRDITERKQAEVVLHKRMEELSTLNQIMQTVANMTDWNVMVQMVVRMMARLFDAKHTSVGLLEGNGDDVVIRADYTRNPTQAEQRVSTSAIGSRLNVSDNPMAMQVIKTKRPLVITDTEKNLKTGPLKDFLKRRGTYCLMLVPLLARGEVIGLIGIDLVEPERVFTDDEVALAETIAGQIAGAIANARLYSAAQQEIEERRKTQAALAQARDEAVEASRFKSQLLAKVSHELRTPLGVILGYTELLQGGTFGNVTHNQAEITGEVIESTHYLTRMVNELLDQAKLEANTLKLENRPFKLIDLLNTVESQMNVLAQAKELDLTFIVDDKLPSLMLGDENRLQQILTNLVGNAIKFTNTGSVVARLYRSQPGYWSMKVTDTGIGIPPEAHDYIFEPFSQVDGSLTRQNAGTGLGLSIVRQLVDLMGGYVTLVSEQGEGSEFTVTLPLVSTQERKI